MLLKVGMVRKMWADFTMSKMRKAPEFDDAINKEVTESECRERIRLKEKRRVNLAWRWRRELAGMGMDLKEMFIVGISVFELVVGHVRVHGNKELRLTMQMKIFFSEKWLL